MKKINIDAIPGLTDPIELTVGGKTFNISGMTKELLDKVTELADQESDNMGVVDLLAKQIRLLINGTEEDYKFFCGLDARVLRATLGRVMETLTEAGERKNALRGTRR